MALLRYMKPIGGLPGPRGSLSSSIPKRIRRFRRQLELWTEVKVLTSGTALRAEIAEYACQHDAAATTWYYSKKLEKPLNESTVKSMKKLYAVNA